MGMLTGVVEGAVHVVWTAVVRGGCADGVDDALAMLQLRGGDGGDEGGGALTVCRAWERREGEEGEREGAV